MDASIDNDRGAAGRFGRPLFEDASARALSRVGVVDVGSNSVRLVIFDGAARSPAYYYNEKIMCALGADLKKTGRLKPKGRKRALAAIKRFQLLAAGMGLAPLAAVATAAVREARDGSEFCAQVRRETGLRLRVIDALDEARLAAQGVLLGWPGARGLVCDMGGASMELAEVADGKVGARATSPLGPLKLQALKGGPTHLRAHIRAEVERLADEIGREQRQLFLVGGSWRAIARLDMERRKYPLHVLHEYRMTPDGLRATLKWIAASDLKMLRARTGISQGRMLLVPEAAAVL
ncbi:MAG: exopolyphosphatase, partial [Paracoccaceae bacterium]